MYKSIFDNLKNMTIEEDAYAYLMMRGVKQEYLDTYQIKQWDSSLVTEPLDPQFKESFGQKGENLDGYVFFPFYSYTNGEFIGFEARNIVKKKIFKMFTKLEPVFFGLNQHTFEQIWNGCNICLVEGIFDFFAMTWCVDQTKCVILSSLTANLSKKQFEFFERFCNEKTEVLITYDNDKAGKDGTKRVIKRFLKAQVKHRVIGYISSTKDPGEIWRLSGKEGLVREFQQRINL